MKNIYDFVQAAGAVGLFGKHQPPFPALDWIVGCQNFLRREMRQVDDVSGNCLSLVHLFYY